jgi:lambda family phage portal protein
MSRQITGVSEMNSRPRDPKTGRFISAKSQPKKKHIKVKARDSRFLNSTASLDPFNIANTGTGFSGQPDFSKATGRRGAEVSGLHTGPSSTSILNVHIARQRSRYAVLSNPYAKRGVDVLVNNIVGRGHKLFSQAKNKEFKKQLEDLWSRWCCVADTTGQLSFAGLEALACRSMIEGGDVFARRRVRRPEDALPVPLQIQVIEAEQVPIWKNEQKSKARTIIGGIEFDPVGRPVNYHMLPSHPGDFFSITADANSAITVPVPAKDVIHLHDVKRPHDVRGMPWLATILIRLADLERYMDAELVRKKGAAMFGGYIRRPADEGFGNPMAIGDNADEDEEVIVDALEPGAFPVLPFGYDVSFSQPADVGPNFQPFLRHQLMGCAVALNALYEQISGDLSGLNDRTLRAGMLEFKRNARVIQENILIHQFCDPIFNWFFDMAILSGELEIPADMTEDEARKHQWIPDRWEQLNPNQELNAEKTEIRSGLKSRDRALLERGEDPEEFDIMVSETKERQEELGVVYDTDVEAVSGSGTQQINSPTINEEEEEQPDVPEEDRDEDEDEDMDSDEGESEQDEEESEEENTDEEGEDDERTS